MVQRGRLGAVRLIHLAARVDWKNAEGGLKEARDRPPIAAQGPDAHRKIGAFFVKLKVKGKA